jgi:LysM repeat protein
MIQKRILGIALIIILLLGIVPALSIAAPNPAPEQLNTNLAKNPGFEGISCRPGSEPPECLDNWTHDVHWPDEPIHDNIFTPQGWVTWWRRGGDYGQPEVKTIPNIAPFNGELKRIHSGHYATLQFTFYRLQDMGLYQCISGLEIGSTLELTAYAHGWSCDDGAGSKMGYSCGDKYNQSFRVGIEPNGVADPFAPSVVWTDKAYAPDHYKLIGPAVAQVGESGTVCIFLRSQTKWQYKYADAYWDDVSLVKTTDGIAPTNTPPPPPQYTAGPPPTPMNTPTPRPDGSIVYIVQPGDTLSLIAQKTGVPLEQIRALNSTSIVDGYIISVGQELVLSLPSVTVEPTTEQPAEPEAVAEAEEGGGDSGGDEITVAGGSICVLSFHDRDSDTFRNEAQEELLPNATFVLANESGIINQYVTDGMNEPYCFTGLAAGSYRVIHTPPSGYEASGTPEQAVAITEDAIINLVFGSKPGGEANLSDAPEDADGEDNTAARTIFSTVAKVGGVLMLLLCVGVGVLFVLNRRRMM